MNFNDKLWNIVNQLQTKQVAMEKNTAPSYFAVHRVMQWKILARKLKVKVDIFYSPLLGTEELNYTFVTLDFNTNKT